MKRAWWAFVVVALASCKVGPNYTRPSAPAPPAFKEQPPESFKEWKPAHPNDDVIRGKWWEIYNDPALNALEEQVNISNQNVLTAEAQFREAEAAIKVSRSSLFPTVSIGPSATAGQGSQNLGAGQVSGVSTVGGGSTAVRTDYFLPLDISWTPDVWGRIRRSVTASVATAQASAAQLENARLSYQSLLAQDYFSLRGLDAEQKFLTESVADFEQYLQLTQERYQTGVASEADVALARTQLEQTRAQLVDLGVQRAQLEHAVAVLTGKPPAEYSAPQAPLTQTPPPVPVALPSELLERRPDVAAAERNMAAANEQIGIAVSAYYPTVTLSASTGLESSSIRKWFTWPSRFWSVGPGASETLLDFGRRRGLLQEAHGAYDATVATYRQAVLTAFQQVEDSLAALRILEQESGVERQAIQAAQESLRVTSEQYKAGVANYLSVLTAQSAVLNTQVTSISILTRRMNASVLLVEALGGGWNTSQLPTVSDLRH
jgi:NodT family efflux transporter outer membrane factor (OMF) lipoprotein